MGQKPKPIGNMKRGCEVVDLSIALDEIYGVWECPDCGTRILHSYFALTDAGSPICDCSGVEMELESTTAQVIHRKGKRAPFAAPDKAVTPGTRRDGRDQCVSAQNDTLAQRLRRIPVAAYGRGKTSVHEVLEALSDDEIAKHLVIPLEMLLAVGRIRKEALRAQKQTNQKGR